MRGRYVRLERQINAFESTRLNFCEVEIYSCSEGYWGYNLNGGGDCLNQCGKCQDNQCSVNRGRCYLGCQAGWWGVAESSVGDCTKQCVNCYDQVCSQSKGICTIGCSYGYWGVDCTLSCHCKDGHACNRGTGQCQNAACDSQYWGPACNNSCNCLDNAPCDVNGVCPGNKCAYGYGGPVPGVCTYGMDIIKLKDIS